MLKVRLCGGVTVEAEGRPLPENLLAGRQGRLVLAYLVCERHRSVPREELAELLWPGRLPSSWTSSLSVVVSKLRRLLAEAGLDGPEALSSAFGSYRLALPGDIWIDWEIASSTLVQAEQALINGQFEVAASSAADTVQIAEQGFLTDDCPWVDSQRERLRDLHVRALLVQAQAYLLGGSPGRAVIAARVVLSHDELREAGYRLLMQALEAVGERAEALRVWERCRVMLAEELGSDPSPETEAVYLSILGEPPSSLVGGATEIEALPSGVVTFLLTDIVDSSGLWERHPAGMAIALERHDRLVAETVAHHRGTLLKAKLEGDATVSVFRRASDAALTALELRDAVAVEPWPEGAVIGLRMAMHTGEAVERDEDYFGPTLNRAARLRALASAGQILVSQVVAEVVRDHLPEGVALTSLGERQLRGLSRDEHVFELGAVVASGDEDNESAPLERPPLPAALAARGPFVGRQAELQRLAAESASAVAGTARAVLIAGEPGVGKSRLAAEWARRAYEQGALVLYGRSDEELGASYQPFAEALRSLIPALGPARLHSIRGIEQLARLVPELTDQLSGGVTLAQGDPDTERALLFDSVVRLFAAVSAEVPVVVVIDDLHWAQKPTLLLLRHLLRAGDPSRLLIVATYRSTDLSRAHPLAAVLADLHRDGAPERLTLAGLAEDEVSAYLLATGHEDEGLGSALSTVTSGNPFFLIEVLHHLEETGVAWDPTTLPQGVREAVDRRLSRLSESANDALLAGAVAGSRFSLDLIEQVMERELVDPIEEARRAGLVVEEPGNHFRFYHALVRQSLLAECVSVKRVRLHQRIATALEADPGGAGLHVADLARHYFECAFAGGAAKAVDYSRQAGEQAMARLAYEEAADLYANALEAAEIQGSGCDQDGRAELLIARCEALLAAGDPSAAAGVVEQLTHASHGSARLSAWATCFEGQLAVLVQPERLEATAADVAAAAEAFARLGDAEGEAKAETVAASCLARLGRVADCEAALDRALVAARLAGNPRRVNAVLGFAPQASLWGPSPVPEASGRCLDVVRVLRITTGSAAVEAAALRCQAVLEAVRGRVDAARRMLGSARRSLESLGHTHGLLETDLFSGLVELIGGQPTEAERLLRHAYEGYGIRGVGTDTAQAAAWLARAVLVQGRVDEALALSAESEALAGVDLKASMAWRAVRAEGLAQQGQIAEALELARSAVALVEPTDALLDQAEAHLTLAVVLRAAGDEPAADREADRAVAAYEDKGATALAAAVRPFASSQRTASTRLAADSVASRRVRENDASAVIREADRLVAAGDFDTWAVGLAPDFVDVDHVSHVTIDRNMVVKVFRNYIGDLDEQDWIDRLLLASLGSRHALFRSTFRFDGAHLVDRNNRTGPAEFHQLHLETIDESGLRRRLERFKPDDLLIALARLVELHANDELLPDQRQGRYALAAQLRQSASPSPQVVQWNDDGVLVDHRPARLGTLRGPDEVRRAMAVTDGLSPDARVQVTDVLGFTDNVIAIEWFRDGHDNEGSYFRIPFITLIQYDADGLILGIDAYLPEQREEALSHFDQLAAPADDGSLENEATRWLAGTWDSQFTADWDTVAASVDEDAVLDDRRAIVGLRVEGGERYLAYARSAVESGLTYYSAPPIATRGQRLALMRMTAGGPITEVQSLAILELSEEGRLRHTVVFDPKDEDAALSELDTRYLAGEGAAYVDTLGPWLAFTAAYSRRDQIRCRELLSPAFRVVDHRGGGPLSALEVEDVLAKFRSAFERLSVLSVERIEGDGAVFLCEADRDERLYCMCITRQGFPTQLDLFPPDQREQANTLLHELISTARPSTRRRVTKNSATERFEHDRILAVGDINSLAALFTEDFVDVDHVSKVTTGREELFRMIRTYQQTTEWRETEGEPLASLGERHALHRITTRMEGASMVEREISTGVIDHVLLVINRTDTAGRQTRLERFKSDDLHLALARLIELHADDELPSDRRPGRYVVANHFRHALSAFNDDSVLVDHRPAGLWTLHGRGAIKDAATGLADLIGEWRPRTADVLALTERLSIFEVVTDGHNDEGGLVQFRIVALSEYGDDGRLIRAELYGPDQIDEAFVRFDELADASVAQMFPEPNTAAIAHTRAADPLLRGDIGEYLALFAPDVVYEDHMWRLSLSGVQAIEDNARYVQTAFDTFSQLGAQLLATRGNRLCLHRVRWHMTMAGSGPVDSELIELTETDEDGLISHFDLYSADDLDAAYADLDARFAAGEGAPFAATLSIFVQSYTFYNQQQWDAYQSTFAEGLAVVDHRRLGWGELDRDGTIALFQGLADLAADTRSTMTSFLRVSERGAVVTYEARGIAVASGGEFTRNGVLVFIIEGLQIQRAEFFSPDDVDKALGRFDELTA